MEGKSEEFNLPPIEGRLASNVSYLNEMFDDIPAEDIKFNAPVPTKEEAIKERQEARNEVAKLILGLPSEVAPSSGEEMKTFIASNLERVIEASSEPPLKETSVQQSYTASSEPSVELHAPVSYKDRKEREEKQVEHLLDAFNANRLESDADKEMEIDDQEDENLDEFLETGSHLDGSPGDLSISTKGSNTANYDSLIANQNDHPSWVACLGSFFEAEGLMLHPDHQNDLEHIFHEFGLCERDVKMYCAGIKRERNLSVMKQLDGLVDRLSTCLNAASTIKTSLNKTLGKQEELVERMFDNMKSTPTVSSASVESTVKSEKRASPVNIKSQTWSQKPAQRWEKPVEKVDVVKKHPSVPQKVRSGSIVIREASPKEPKPKETWQERKKEDLSKDKGKASLTSEQEQIMELIGMPKEIYLSPNFISYVSKKLDPSTINGIKIMDADKYPTLKEVFMDIIWKEYKAEHPESGKLNGKSESSIKNAF